MTDSVWLKEHGFVESKCRKCGIDVIEPKEHLTHYCGECHQESLDMHNKFERQQNIYTVYLVIGIALILAIPFVAAFISQGGFK